MPGAGHPPFPDRQELIPGGMGWGHPLSDPGAEGMLKEIRYTFSAPAVQIKLYFAPVRKGNCFIFNFFLYAVPLL